MLFLNYSEQMSSGGIMQIKPIAYIKSDFSEKFGIPRQSGIVGELASTIVFEEEYRNPDAVRGLEDFSHLWLIWGFSEVRQEGWSPTVRPPRLGGNARMGVFATRSPFRPNPIGLSSVRLDKIEKHVDLGIIIHVLGADLMDGTPIYDIKPYLAFTDSHPASIGGFADKPSPRLEVVICEACKARLPEKKWLVLRDVLALDPRPAYQDDPSRVYGMSFGGYEIKFSVADNVLTVCGVENGA